MLQNPNTEYQCTRKPDVKQNAKDVLGQHEATMNLTQSLWFFKCEASVNHFGNNLKQRGYKKAMVLSCFDTLQV